MSSEPIFLAAYMSDATTSFEQSELLELLATSRVNNARIGVSGLLLHAGGNFLQALEGPETEVRETLVRIEGDPRHRNMQILFFDHIPERLFAEWSMGFQEAYGLMDSEHPGLSAFMQQGKTTGGSDHGVIELLRSFRDVPVDRPVRI